MVSLESTNPVQTLDICGGSSEKHELGSQERQGGWLLIWRTRSIDELEEKGAQTEANLKVPANRRCLVAPIAWGQITLRESVDTRLEKSDNMGALTQIYGGYTTN